MLIHGPGSFRESLQESTSEKIAEKTQALQVLLSCIAITLCSNTFLYYKFRLFTTARLWKGRLKLGKV